MTEASTLTYLDEIKDNLYGDLTITKIWGVASPALDLKDLPSRIPHYAPDEKYLMEDKV